jgi:hypothetical protein
MVKCAIVLLSLLLQRVQLEPPMLKLVLLLVLLLLLAILMLMRYAMHSTCLDKAFASDVTQQLLQQYRTAVQSPDGINAVLVSSENSATTLYVLLDSLVRRCVCGR